VSLQQRRTLRVLVVVNKGLPQGDYRLAHARTTRRAEQIVFALPSRPDRVTHLRHVQIGFSEGLRASTFAALLRLLVYLRRHRRQLALVHFYSTVLTLTGPLVSRLAGVPSIVTITGFGRVYNSTDRRYRLLRPLYNWLAHASGRTARAVLFQNHGDLATFRSRHPALVDKCHYVGSGVAAPMRVRQSYDDVPLTVVHVARLLPSKGIDDFLAVAARTNRSDVRFRLAGPPARGAEALLNRVRQAHAEGIAEYLGELPSSDARELLEDAHVLLFTSYGEGMARVMLEAGFAGTCPLAYSIAANRDAIGPGRGLLVDVGDIDAASLTLERLAADRQLLAENARNYQRYVVDAFGADTFVARLDSLLDRVLAAESDR
jgi:glycosyltransferase involved in cell wall biosynthesis